MSFIKQIFNSFKKKPPLEKKSYTGGSSFSDYVQGNLTINNPKAAFDEGYYKNVIVYQCVNLIANAVSTLPIELKRKAKNGDAQDITMHPMLDLLKTPTPWTNQKSFLYQAIINYSVSGVCYVAKNQGVSGNQILQLQVLPSHAVNIEQGPRYDLPQSYTFNPASGQATQHFPVNQVTGECDLLAFKKYNPLQEIYGLSPLQPSAAPVGNHNSGLSWNASLLENSSKPTGVLSTEQLLSDEDFERIAERQRKQHEGVKNAGKTRVLEGGLNWQQTGLSPIDMDFQNSIETAARNIGAAYNIPHQLIVKGESTYNNYEIAKQSFYTDCVLPLAKSFLEALSGFVNDRYPDYYYVVNEGSIDALELKRELRSKRISQMIKDGRITLNEARKMDDLEAYEVPEADQPLISRSFIPLEDVSIDETLNNIKPPEEEEQGANKPAD